MENKRTEYSRIELSFIIPSVRKYANKHSFWVSSTKY